MDEPNQMLFIVRSLIEMLDELDKDELNMVEDFIVNHCENMDHGENPDNLFRMLIGDVDEVR